jgi:acetyltransferase-like isoleucine patch superfamily enzyme
MRLRARATRWLRRLRGLRGLASDPVFWATVDYHLEARKFSREEQARTQIGTGSFFNGGPNIIRFAIPPPDGVTVGNYCSIAAGVELALSGNHRLDHVTSSGAFAKVPDEAVTTKGGIAIGSDVWIGKDALILSGTTIGDGGAVAARAVVTKDVRPYAIVAGNPAREIGRRFPDEIVDRLLAARWWDWPRHELDAVADLLCSDRVGELLDYAEGRTRADAPAESPISRS